MTDPRLVSSTAISERMKRPSEDTRLAYSIPEAVTISGIGRTLLYAEIAAGRLLAVKAGRRTLIPRTALERFISTLPSATENGFIRLTNKAVKGNPERTPGIDLANAGSRPVKA